MDMQEIQLMAVGQSQVLTTLIDELQRSNGADRQQLLATTAQPDVFAAVLHRLKGSFALAGYQSGVNLCQQLPPPCIDRANGDSVAYECTNSAFYRFTGTTAHGGKH
ncbi:TPA: Hpt domain-containing protein [Klebsiella quasipneumoniae subsp. quasipneumoniae]|nr:Hpt domain-containing protein [Klebsiella quasipneumoniae subsp. quasipneumoniae]